MGAEFVWHVEDVLDLYAAAPGQPRKEDYEYRREGTCNLFLFFAPHDSWRHVYVTERWTAVDFAHELQWLVDVRYPQAEVIRLVTDNLNTHSPASLYQTFAPAEARRIARKIEWHYTPQHGSWLDMCELELSVLSRQCLNQRLPSAAAVAHVAAAWEEKRNASGATVHWRFRTEHARIRLARIYPEISA